MSAADRGDYGPLVGRIYNAMHPEGWRWENLTSGEQAEARAPIVAVLDGLQGAGCVILSDDD